MSSAAGRLRCVAAAAGPLQTYGGFADALKLKLTATRAKMQALGTRPPAAGR